MIYLDHAATTKVYPEVVREMEPFFTEHFGNPSSSYAFGNDAKAMIDRARRQIAKTIGASAEEIYFTSGGTEADNWALIGIAEKMQEKGKHIITSQIEHHAVLRTCEYLEKRGFEITYLPVDEEGLVQPMTLEKAIRDDTILISIMYANNEIGSVQPIREIGKIAKEHRIIFHTDAVQAYLHERILLDECQIDLLSASGHKFGAPKGVGFLYIRKGLALPPLLHGGDQERKIRAGTENTAGIVGMGKASAMGERDFESRHARLMQMRDALIQRILNEIPDSRLNGSAKERLDANVNVSFKEVEGETLLLLLDMEGICVSGGSACNSSGHGVSHVLQAIHVPEGYIRGTIRITIGAENTMEELDYFVDRLKALVLEQRKEE